MEKRDVLYIGGEWVTPASGKTIEVISPATEEVVGVVPEAAEGDVDRAVEAARKAFDEGPWPQTTPICAIRRPTPRVTRPARRNG